MIKVISSEQRVSSPLVEVEPTAPRYQYFKFLPPGVIEPFQKALPPRIFVDFIQAKTGLGPAGNRGRPLPEVFRVFNDRLTVAFDILVEVKGLRTDLCQEVLCKGRFAHLPRPGNEGHFFFLKKKPADFRGQITHG